MIILNQEGDVDCQIPSLADRCRGCCTQPLARKMYLKMTKNPQLAMPSKFVLTLVILMICLLACQRGQRNVVIQNPPRDKSELSDPHDALAGFRLYPGLKIQPFASEPMLINPTNIDVDERGRIWVCEVQNYRGFRNDHPQRQAGDRILILEDTDGDGSADLQKVFYQGQDVNAALGIAKLGQQIYVAASPNMLIFTDLDGDDVPDSKDTLFTGLAGIDHDHGVHAIVFGPDGKLYFNFGNEGKRLRLKSGDLAKDKRGQEIEEGNTFRQGMIFRCNADGSDLEILGHNFRNNYEVAVDPFGALWQSDNDDDGNKATRINFVMEYGNYGFKDAVTGAGWRTPRIGMHEEVPKRHWHLNDPGVVPNLLQTGAGSPTGMLVYEGTMLPKVFQGQMIHCEPGKNVVRAYPVVKDGAGYKAEIVPILISEDTWFRPSDVCAAPDGSIFISDWYDEGVGGHLMADIQQGRIYRIHTEGQGNYRPQAVELSTASQAVRHLNHVNQATRFLAHQRVVRAPNAAELLTNLIDSCMDTRLKARAYWCLAGLPNYGWQSAQRASSEHEPNLRKTALRIGRQFLSVDHQLMLIDQLKNDTHIDVLREGAISLRFLSGLKANQLWTHLARKYDGQDRWYLEALGIGSDLDADARWESYQKTMDQRDLVLHPDITWRIKSPLKLERLEALILQSSSAEEMVRYFRALHFLPRNKTAPLLVRVLDYGTHPLEKDLIRFALASLSPEMLETEPSIQEKIREVLPDLRGSSTWTMLVRSANLRDEAPILLDSALLSHNENFRKEAIHLVHQLMGAAFVQAKFRKSDLEGKVALLELMSHVQNKTSRAWKHSLFKDLSQPEIIRHRAAYALSKDWQGMEELMSRIEQGEMQKKDAEVVATYLTQSWRNDIQQQAIAWITKTRGKAPLNLNDLATRIGNSKQGAQVFDKYCQACHQIDGKGLNFGPDLSEIGDKLGKDGLLSAIVYPSLGIGFGYEGFEVKTKDGHIYHGFIESQTDESMTLRMMGGVTQEIPLGNIEEKTLLSASLMTANLHQLMEGDELVDLVEYLSQLGSKEVL